MTDINKKIEEAANDYAENFSRVDSIESELRIEGFKEGARWALEYVKEATDFYEEVFGKDITKGEKRD